MTIIKKESGECFYLMLGFFSLRIWKTGNGANGLRGAVYTPILWAPEPFHLFQIQHVQDGLDGTSSFDLFYIIINIIIIG